ncbi:MAG: hypothetical protein KJ066_04700 [Acidobacteria bacterium]|nr:hypothetical protein [Acidobacteriota bacterium]
MRTHIDLLGLLYVLAAVLSWIVAAAVLALAGGALSIAWSAAANGGVAARVTATVFVTVASIVAGWGAANFVVGRAIRRCEPWGRTVGLGLAIVHLFVLPFGTALGVYALWVLVGNETRRVFERRPPAAVL